MSLHLAELHGLASQCSLVRVGFQLPARGPVVRPPPSLTIYRLQRHCIYLGCVRPTCMCSQDVIAQQHERPNRQSLFRSRRSVSRAVQFNPAVERTQSHTLSKSRRSRPTSPPQRPQHRYRDRGLLHRCAPGRTDCHCDSLGVDTRPATASLPVQSPSRARCDSGAPNQHGLPFAPHLCGLPPVATHGPL
ncbi:hypothetical protein NDU88_005551 [Pleurodeles waltl]|uniref:Uncharacterized protein n=1 Tax=Pleurodeles waltl TaxID=8319 RepID=A0AAV7QJC9_PLEWA|nr:hypothetical protein NDU88_005551 [Pleurodeles waltl]